MLSRHRIPKNLLFCLVAGLVIVSTSGCTEYWWTRGQPPSVAELMARSQKSLAEKRKMHGQVRSEVGLASEQIELSLQQAVSLVQTNAAATEVAEQLSVAEQAFMNLDPVVSVGSRAALGELSGQLRVMSQQSKDGVLPAYKSIGLFTARCFNFLANELVMPAPGIG